MKNKAVCVKLNWNLIAQTFVIFLHHFYVTDKWVIGSADSKIHFSTFNRFLFRFSFGFYYFGKDVKTTDACNAISLKRKQ